MADLYLELGENKFLKRLFYQYFYLLFCHVECNETSHFSTVEILYYIQHDKENNTLIMDFTY